ncbi:MAG: helix-turn-helix domain-containing protein [Planctomycetes bacterium]|nr:helix-turn-helix domain-containing protein [Planctomycetota bacterium]
MTAETLEKIQPALLTIPQVCEYLNISRASFYKINATGAFGLLPVKLGICRKVLYSRFELDAYIRAGCPHRKIWQAQRKGIRL